MAGSNVSDQMSSSRTGIRWQKKGWERNSISGRGRQDSISIGYSADICRYVIRIEKRLASLKAMPARICRPSRPERSLRYGIDFAAGYSVGLFVDQRENRRFVRQVAPKNLLNCFSYTCSFSVAAATVDAKTVSIDLSKKSLARGKENFALNSLATNGHQFIADDVMEVLPRLARKGEKFDVIILDPPTFSRSHRGKAFQVEQDFETLLLAALEVAERDARILLSTNCMDLRDAGLEVMARYCLKTTRRAGTFHQEPALPDFPRECRSAHVMVNASLVLMYFPHANKPRIRKLSNMDEQSSGNPEDIAECGFQLHKRSIRAGARADRRLRPRESGAGARLCAGRGIHSQSTCRSGEFSAECAPGS